MPGVRTHYGSGQIYSPGLPRPRDAARIRLTWLGDEWHNFRWEKGLNGTGDYDKSAELNGYTLVWRWDGQALDRTELAKCAFKSPMWDPDHQDARVLGSLGFTSTQRFITPESPQGLMPYRDEQSGCLIVADSLLTHREALAARLGLSGQNADCVLILAAYLKWGRDCARSLSGPFSFAIWDPRAECVFAAVDHFGLRPIYFAHVQGKYLILANTMAPFRVLLPQLTVNEDYMAYYALDCRSDEDTCYREVRKIRYAHQVSISRKSVEARRYWNLEDQKRVLPCKKREDYYLAFRELFQDVVKDHMRTDTPVTAHISGGLDSTSVACLAARWSAARNRTLLGFTAFPHVLEGPSFRKGWQFHERPLVEAVRRQYPNIGLSGFHTDPAADPYAELAEFYPWVDQPYRNIKNFPWILDSMRQTARRGGRLVLTGYVGNSSISWTGNTFLKRLRILHGSLRTWMHPDRMFGGLYDSHHRELLQSHIARNLLRHRGIVIRQHSWALKREFSASILGSTRSQSLVYGVEMMDPTCDVKLTEFCYNVPNWVYCRGPGKMDQRLLVREGMAGIVPEAVRRNPFRGEQSPDWHLHFNTHREGWRERLERLPPQAQSTLWRLYDRKSILSIIDRYVPKERPDPETNKDVIFTLMRCFSLGFFLEYLHGGMGNPVRGLPASRAYSA